MRAISIDVETYSSVDLAKSGVYRYAESPDFEITLFGYSVDNGEVQVVDFASGEKLPDEISSALIDPAVTKWAFNAQFERICLSKWFGLPEGQYLDPKSWRCTMVWSAYMGLPLSLEGSGAVLGLEKHKLTEGKDLIRYFCQPCKPTAGNGQRTRNLPVHAPDKWVAFKAYNLRDVEAEISIKAKLEKFPVPDSVWAEYHLDQEINDRGVALDMTLVLRAIEADERSRSKLTRIMRELTELENPNSVVQMKQWLSDHGLETDTLGKKAVSELLKTAPEPLSKVLELRQSLAKSSVKKYTAMENAACADGRARGMFQFYGANRTGRWAGRLIQLQNLPQSCCPNSSVPPLYRKAAANSSWRTSQPLKRGSSPGLRAKNGGRQSLNPAAISTALPLPRCFVCQSKNTVLTVICDKKAKSRNSPSDTADRSVRSKLWVLWRWDFTRKNFNHLFPPGGRQILI